MTSRLLRQETFPGNQGGGIPVTRTERLDFFFEFVAERITEIHGIEGFAANGTAYETHRCHVVPSSGQKVLKLYGAFRADSPTITATGTKGHIVKEGPLLALIPVIQGACRAILHTGQAAVAFLIDSKVRHRYVSPLIGLHALFY